MESNAEQARNENEGDGFTEEQQDGHRLGGLEPGDYIIGTLVNKEPKNETSGLSARYYLENEEGTLFLWGCAVLDDRMQYAKVGDKVRITFEGETTNKRQQRVKLYRVEVAGGRQPQTANGVEGPKPSAPVHLEELEDVM